jgi:hypothetical protein
MKTISAEHSKNMFCPYSALVVFMYWTGNSMNNPLSYCGLIGAKTRASDKYLPVQLTWKSFQSRIFMKCQWLSKQS